MSEFTPGPWKSSNNHIDTADRKHGIASCNTANDDYEANARLIAAAPDMFKMLHVLWVNIPSTVLKQYGLSEIELLAIINKAKGE